MTGVALIRAGEGTRSITVLIGVDFGRVLVMLCRMQMVPMSYL